MAVATGFTTRKGTRPPFLSRMLLDREGRIKTVSQSPEQHRKVVTQRAAAYNGAQSLTHLNESAYRDKN